MNTLVTGIPGKGKTEGQHSRILGDVGHKALMIIDPQASLSIRLMMYLLDHLRYVIYIRLRDIRRAVGFINLQRSTNPHPMSRMQEDRDARMTIARLFLGRRALDPTTSPLIWEFLEWGLRLIQYSGSPLYFLPYCFQLCKELHWMMNKCDDQETFNRFYAVTQWSPTRVRQEMSPALRVVETVCLDPAFIAACGDFDLKAALRNRRIIILEGQGANHETIRTIALFTLLTGLQFSEKEKYPAHYVVDELENFGFATPDVLLAINTLRKQDADITLITQSLGFEPAVVTKLMQGCDRHEWFASSPDMAAIGARDMLPKISRYEVWYKDQRTRQVNDGYREYEGIEGKIVPVYGEVTEEVVHYMSFSDQIKEFEKELMTLPVGSRIVNQSGKVFREHVSLLEEPYPWEISSLKVEQAIQEIQKRPEYREPSMITVPEMPRSSPSSKKTSQASRNGSKPESSPITKLRQGGQQSSKNGKRTN